MQKVTNKEILRQLLLAKAMSDKKDYTSKYNIMQKLIKENPDDFIIDQEDPNFPGVTHKPTGFRMHLPSSIKPAISKSASVNKKANLGYKALTGNVKPIKDIIRALRAKGYAGLGGKVTDPITGAIKRVPIARVIPKNIDARLANTSHLPIGTSTAFLGQTPRLVVGKGHPRTNLIRNESGVLQHVPGVAGGTNPSPISSLLHESGHLLHSDSVVESLSKNPDLFNRALHKDTTKYGVHRLNESPELSVLLDEVGANNSALQILKQYGATNKAQLFYQLARYPSYRSHVQSALKKHTGDIPTFFKKLEEEAPYGFTRDYSGIDRFYNNHAGSDLIGASITKSSAVDGRVSDLTSHENYEGIKQDRKLSTVTVPSKSGLSGFITNLKKGKVAEPDRRFNNIDASLKLAKQAMIKEGMDPYRLAVNLLKFNTKSRGVSNNITLLQRLRSVVELNKPTTRRAFISEASTLPKQTNISNKPVASTKSIAPYLYQPQLNRRNFIKRFALGNAVDKPTREVVKGVMNEVVQIPQKALHLL